MSPRWLPFILLACCAIPNESSAQDSDVPRLIEKLTRDEKEGNRRKAAHDLGALGAKAEKAVPALVKALEDPDVGVRDEVEAALTRIGEAAVPGLLQGLKHDYQTKDEFQFVRVRIVTILGSMGQAAGKTALEALEESVAKDPSSFVREAAEKAAFRVKVDPKTLVALLKDKDEAQRIYAVKGFGFLGGQLAKGTGIKALGDSLRSDKSKEVRKEAAKTLGSFGREALPVLDKLASALNDADAEVRLQAVIAIGAMGTDARQAVGLVQAALAKHGRKDEAFKDAAETTIVRLMGRRRQ